MLDNPIKFQKFEKREVIPDNWIPDFYSVRTSRGWENVLDLDINAVIYTVSLDNEMGWQQPKLFSKMFKSVTMIEHDTLDDSYAFPKSTKIRFEDYLLERYRKKGVVKTIPYKAAVDLVSFNFAKPCFVPVSLDNFNYILLPV